MKYFIDTEFIEGFSKWTFAKNRHFIDLISIAIVGEDGRVYSAISKEYHFNDADKWVQDNVIIPLYTNTVHGDARNRYTAENFHKTFGKSNKQIAQEICEFINYGIDNFVFKITRADCWAECFYKDEFAYQRKHNTFIPKTIWKSGDNGTEKNMFLFYNQPEFYAYFADYDWVLLCSLFGRMIDLPQGFPMYCNDLKQSLDEEVGKLKNSDFFQYFHVDKPLTFNEKLEAIKKFNKKYPAENNGHNALEDAVWNKDLFNFIQTLKKNKLEG